MLYLFASLTVVGISAVLWFMTQTFLDMFVHEGK
jgi:hypothetical protein